MIKGGGSTNDNVREKQAVEMRNMINAQGISSAEPVVITGDFNVDFHSQVRLSLPLCLNTNKVNGRLMIYLLAWGLFTESIS